MSENDKVLRNNAAGAFVVKGAALVVSLFTMPAYMRYFSDQQTLGVWFTLLSVLSWILNFDFGIGNGLRNNLTVALALSDRRRAKEFISSAYWMLGIVVVVLTFVGSGVLRYADWNSVFNVKVALIPSHELLRVTQFIFLGIMLQFFLRLVSAVLYALQKSAINNFIALLTSVLQLLFVLIAPIRSPFENLKMLSVAYIFTSSIPLFVASLIVFLKPLRDCCPNPHFFRRDKAKAVLSLGGIFFICQLLYMLIANTNEFFITKYTDPKYVVEYQIYSRLFTLSSMLIMLALTPVWSAVSKANAEKDYPWLSKLSSNLMKLSFLGMLLEIALIPFLQIIVNFWLKDRAIQINYSYAVIFALFGTTMIFQTAISTITNGMGRMRIQAISYAIGVIAKLLIIHFGVAVTGSWIVVVLANAVILIPYCIVQQIDIRKYLNKHTMVQEG